MTYKEHTVKSEVTAVDIDTMRDMSTKDYKEYLSSGLVYVDHHEILRSMPAGYPLAVTQEQVQALISHLKEIAPQVG